MVHPQKPKLFIYFTKTKPELVAHRIAANWARMWFMKLGLRTNEIIYKWEYEPNYGLIRPDSLVIIYNQLSHKYRAYFLEYDLSPRNDFDKITKYNYWHKSGGYEKQWWAEKLNDFPDIKIFTCTDYRKRSITNRIKSENSEKLIFDVDYYNKLEGEARNKWIFGK